MKARAFQLLFCLILAAVVSAPVAERNPPPLMLATVYEADVDVADYWISEKLDGVRGHWTGGVLLTRGGHVVATPGWFVADWPDTPMDGELWIGRGRFDDVSGIVRSRQPDDDAWRQVKFMVFDLPAHGGTFEARVMAMRSMLSEAAIPWLQPVDQFRVADSAALNTRLAAVIDAGGEGLMLHHREARYRIGRSEHLLKLRAYDDAEARVVGHTLGKGKYRGMLGALIVERPDGVRFRLGSGFTDAQRAEPPPVGSWVTYRYNGLTANGIPRFARFLRIRHDMPPPDPD